MDVLDLDPGVAGEVLAEFRSVMEARPASDSAAGGRIRRRSGGRGAILREGLKLRASELEKLTGALHEVKRAKDRLYEKAGEILGLKKPSA